VLALALAEKNIYTRLVYWTGFGINVYVWIVSFTRGAWIGGAVGIALMGIVAWRHHSKLQWIDLVPVGATAAAGGTAIIRSLSSSNAVMNFWARLASIPQLNEGSGLTRTEIWKAAIAAITHSPMRFILGYGADTFRLVFPRFKPIEYTRDAGYLSVADNVHDYPLQLAAGIGVVGVALLYGIFAWAAARSFKIVFGRSDDPNRLLVGGFWTAAAAYLVQLMFGLSVTGNTFLLWVCIGVVLAPTATSFEFKAREWGMGAATVALVLAMSGVGYQFVLMYADYQYLLANVALSGQAQVDAAKLAVRLNPFNDMYRSEVGMAYRQELVSAGTAMAQAQQTGGNASQYAVTLNDSFQNAVAALQDTINFVPDEYDNYVFIASVYNAGGNFLDPKYFQDAIAWAKKGIEVEPYGPAIRVEYARALVSSGQLDAGLNMLESAWAMDHAYVDAAELLAQVYEQKGQYAQAADVLRQTQAANPSDTSIAPLLKAAEASATAASSTPATAK